MKSLISIWILKLIQSDFCFYFQLKSIAKTLSQFPGKLRALIRSDLDLDCNCVWHGPLFLFWVVSVVLSIRYQMSIYLITNHNNLFFYCCLWYSVFIIKGFQTEAPLRLHALSGDCSSTFHQTLFIWIPSRFSNSHCSSFILFIYFLKTQQSHMVVIYSQIQAILAQALHLLGFSPPSDCMLTINKTMGFFNWFCLKTLGWSLCVYSNSWNITLF